MDCLCCLIPPYLLESIAKSDHNAEDIRRAARVSLEHQRQMVSMRKEGLAELSAVNQAEQFGIAAQGIVPPHLSAGLSGPNTVDDPSQVSSRADLTVQKQPTTDGSQSVKAPTANVTKRIMFDSDHATTEAALPGTLVRSEGQSIVVDEAVNAAFSNIGFVIAFYRDEFSWNSLDNEYMDIVSSVHVGNSLQNAYWNGTEMLFGDGGDFIYNFTSCLDVIAHELTHGVTAHTTALCYESESGALNEHLSDVFGIMAKQRAENVTAEKADWLIGEGCLLPGVTGVAIRSMKAPGTAYNDKRFGKDIQVSTMKDFRKLPLDLEHDYGGVHINSGIPNRAFYLVATRLGGYSWEKAGRIWWRAIQSQRIPSTCTFQQFAEITVDCAKDMGNDDAAAIIRAAWDEVGVVGSDAPELITG